MVSGKERTLLLGAVLPTAACLALLLVQWHSSSCHLVEIGIGSGLLACTQHVRFVGDQRTALVRVRRKEGLLFKRREVRWVLQACVRFRWQAHRRRRTAPASHLLSRQQPLPLLARFPHCACRSSIGCW